MCFPLCTGCKVLYQIWGLPFVLEDCMEEFPDLTQTLSYFFCYFLII